MSTFDKNSFLFSLLRARSANTVRDLLRAVGDSSEAGLDSPFGAHRLCWKAFGGNASNISTIGLGTKPGKSLSERITNAIDAILEDRATNLPRTALPESARQAANEWFGRPLTGPEQGLYRGMAVETDKRINVLLLDSGVEDSPTIDVVDDGVGLSPEEFPSTILSLQAGNKIRKKHQIGAFGQGGAATLGFSEFTIIVSRSKADPKRVAFTVVRVLRLDVSWKEDCYAFLAMATDSGGFEILEAAYAEAIPLYEERTSPEPPRLSKGTLVRHVQYRLGAISKALAPSPGNLYHYLHYSLFDPVLPFRLLDLRRPEKARNELVRGSRNRLMRLASERSSAEEDKEARVQVRHHRPMEFVTPLGGDCPCIGVEYWVVFAFRKKEDRYELRGNSAELFVQPNHPIVGTLNGQTQGELTAHLLKEINLGLVSKHIVVHIDATEADNRVRRELFSTSREGFKEGPILEGLIASLRRMLQDDTNLFEIEKELTEKLARREAASTREEVRQQVTRLLKEAGFQVSDMARTDVAGQGKPHPIPRPKAPHPTRVEPLPTLPFPQVTRLEIVYPQDLLQVHLSDSELVIVETDADPEFDRRGLVLIRTEPCVLEVESKSQLRGGRIRWRMRPREGARAGDAGELIVTITRPDGSQLTGSRAFEVLPVLERPARKSAAQVPPFEIQPIGPEDTERWELLWPDDLGDSDRQRAHAYKAVVLEGKTVVFYSTAFGPFAEAMEKLKTSSPMLVDTFEVNYSVWIGYHAILQQQAQSARSEDIGDEEKLESLRDQERSVVARMQVRQALTMTELMRKGVGVSATD